MAKLHGFESNSSVQPDPVDLTSQDDGTQAILVDPSLTFSMFSQENPCVLTDSDDDDALPLGDEVYEPESTDEADEPGPVAEDNRARRRRGRRPVEIPLPTDAEMQQAAQEEQELAERVEADIQACSNRIRQKYEETRHTRWTAKIREGAWVKRQIAHTLQKRGYEAAQQAMYNLEQTLYQFDVVHRPQPDNPDATCISGNTLVVGAVQAGKFAALEFLIAAALDMGFRSILVLAGQTNHLRNQAEGRTAVLVGDFSNQLDMDEMMNDHITWLTSSVHATKRSTDVDANEVIGQLRNYIDKSGEDLEVYQTTAAGRQVAALHARLEALSDALLAKEEPQGAVVAVVKKTEDSLAALFEGLKSMYPGFKHEPIFMGIDEIDEGSLGDPYRMAKGKVTVCQKIVALAEQHDVAAICCATASPSAVKLINLRKFEQVGLGLIVPKRLWQQELAPGHSYAGHQAYCGPRGDPANNIIPSSDCPGHAISKQMRTDPKQAHILKELSIQDPQLISIRPGQEFNPRFVNDLLSHTVSASQSDVDEATEAHMQQEADRGGLYASQSAQLPPKTPGARSSGSKGDRRPKMHSLETAMYNFYRNIAEMKEGIHSTDIPSSVLSSIVDMMLASAEQWVRIFGHTVGWQLGQTRTMLQWTALSHLRSPDSQSMPQGYQLPEALASKPPVKLIGLIQLCRQHCADAGGIAHAQFDSELGGQIQLAKDDIEATCFKSNQHVHRLLGVLADMLSGKRPPNAARYKEQLGCSAIFKQCGAGHKSERSDQSGLGMHLLMILHRTFLKLKMSLKLAFLGLDFEKDGTDVRLVHHPVAGSYFHPLGIPADTSKTFFALAIPEATAVSTSIDQVFPVLLPQDTMQWNHWCSQQHFLPCVTPPERFFQTALINVARSTEVHSKVADVWEQALLIVSKCINPWVTDRISNRTGTCNVPVPTDVEMGHMPQKQQTALLSRFDDSVKVLTGEDGILDQRLAHQQQRTHDVGGEPITLTRLQARLKHLTSMAAYDKAVAEVVIVNSYPSTDPRTRTDFVQDVKNLKRSMWAPELAFLVSSDLLGSRGTTLINLLNQTYLRQSKQTLADRLMQAQRVYAHVGGYKDLISLYMPARTYIQMRRIAANDNHTKLDELTAVLDGKDPFGLPLRFDRSAYMPTSAAHRRDAHLSAQSSSWKQCFISPAYSLADAAYPALVELLDCILRDEDAVARGRASLGAQAGEAWVAKGVQYEPVLDFLQTYLSDENMQHKAHVIMDKVNERRESINVVIVKQSPAVRESKYSQAMVLDDPNRWTATHNEIEVELEAPKSPAQHMLPDFIYMNTRIKRRVGEKLHPPNASYMAPGSIPRLFFDAEGTYNGSFQDSVITGASRAWYSQPGETVGGAGPSETTDLFGARYGTKTTRTARAPMCLVIFSCHPTFVGTARDGQGLFVKKGSQYAASMPLPAVMGLLPGGNSPDMLRKGTASFEPSVAASIANQPALTGSLAKKLQTLCDIVSELDKEDTENLLSRQVTHKDKIDQGGLVDGVSLLDGLHGEELTMTLTHIQARLRLSHSKEFWSADPDNIPYVSEKHVAADMTSLFTHTKRLYGSEGNLQGNTLRNLQQTWLSQCSDKIQRQRKVNLVELHDAWEYADASDIRTLKHAQQRLRDAIEDTSVAKPNNATALMRAVQRAVYVFLVFAVKPEMPEVRRAITTNQSPFDRILRRLTGCFGNTYQRHRSRMHNELHKLMRGVDLVMEDLDEFSACELPKHGDLPEIKKVHGQGRKQSPAPGQRRSRAARSSAKSSASSANSRASGAGRERRIPQLRPAAADEDSNDEGEAVGHDMDEERSGDEADPAEPNEFDWMVGDDEEIEYDHGQGGCGDEARYAISSSDDESEVEEEPQTEQQLGTRKRPPTAIEKLAASKRQREKKRRL